MTRLFPKEKESKFLQAKSLFGYQQLVQIFQGVDEERHQDVLDYVIFVSEQHFRDRVRGCHGLHLDRIEALTAERDRVQREFDLYRAKNPPRDAADVPSSSSSAVRGECSNPDASSSTASGQCWQPNGEASPPQPTPPSAEGPGLETDDAGAAVPFSPTEIFYDDDGDDIDWGPFLR